jgi:flavin reductase (DIM6/NTAB) family NADH-FMN oxidoreductase RutF
MTALLTEAALPSIDTTELRRCLGSFVTGVTVITALDAQGQPEGITANSFSSLSLEPPLIVWSLRLSSRSFDTYQNAAHFAVNILAQDQVHLSNRFAASGIKRFDGVAYAAGLAGVPLLSGCVATLECKLQATHPGGDHVLFVGRVERIHTNSHPPLAYGNGGYLSVQPLDVD